MRPACIVALATACLLAATCAKPPAKDNTLEVVTTLEVLAHWVRAVGGDRVRVQSLLSGYEDPHNFEPQPADAQRIARAKLLLRVGLGLEEWLDGLVANAGNRELVAMDLADGIDVIGRGGEAGPGHDQGNPHIWLDPANAGIAARRIAAELGRLDPGGDSIYAARAVAYSARLDSVTAVLQAEVGALPDHRFIGFHDAWPYFNRRFGFEAAAYIEPVPGQEPSARRLAELVELVRRERVRVVVTEPQLPSELPNTLARETGARVVVLNALRADSLPGDPYIGLLATNVRRLAAALRQ